MRVVIKDRRTTKCLWVNIEGEGLCFTTDLSARQWESWVRFWVRGRRWEKMRVFCRWWVFYCRWDALVSDRVRVWGIYVWVWRKVRVFWTLSDSEKWNKSWVCVLCLKYDHKSSIRNSILTWLHVEKSSHQIFVAQDFKY